MTQIELEKARDEKVPSGPEAPGTEKPRPGFRLDLNRSGLESVGRFVFAASEY